MSSSLTAAPSDVQGSDARFNTIPSLDGAPPLVTVRHLTKTYRGRPALRDLSLSLPAGRIVGLMGANGCGKTTLLKILAGVLADYEGQVRIAGHAPGPLSKALVSFLPDADFLATSLTPPRAIASSPGSSPISTPPRPAGWSTSSLCPLSAPSRR